jgi:hypothetical protein
VGEVLNVNIEQSGIGSTTMNKHVPFIWQVNYRNEPRALETVLEIAHEKARQILEKNLKLR